MAIKTARAMQHDRRSCAGLFSPSHQRTVKIGRNLSFRRDLSDFV